MRFLALLFISTIAQAQFTAKQCKEIKTHNGDSYLRYCDNGTDQLLEQSNELDDEDDPKDKARVRQIIAMFKKRDKGTFKVVTKDSGGGSIDLYQDLIRAVEKSCKRNCFITTEVHGFCESACGQLHVTCVKNARTIAKYGSRVCDHASTASDCKQCDPNPPYKCNVCGAADSVEEYKQRCGSFVKGTDLEIDRERKKQVEAFADRLAEQGVFRSSKFTCNMPPWAEVESSTRSASGPESETTR